MLCGSVLELLSGPPHIKGWLPDAHADAGVEMERSQQIAELRRQLHQHFPRSQTTSRPRRGRLSVLEGPWSTGIDEVDQLLPEGGIPRGRISEFTGPASSGKLALALGCVASATQAGQAVAWIDLSNSLFPPSAVGRGVVLERLLVIRPGCLRKALIAADLLLRGRAFGLVVLDWGLDVPGVESSEDPDLGSAVARLNGLVALGKESLLLVTTPQTARDPFRYYASVRLEVTRIPWEVQRRRGMMASSPEEDEPGEVPGRSTGELEDTTARRGHLRLVVESAAPPRARELNQRAAPSPHVEGALSAVKLVKNKLGAPGAVAEVNYGGWQTSLLPLHSGVPASGSFK